MNKEKEALIKILELYAATINSGIVEGYHAFVDNSGAIPQLCIN